MLKGIGVAALFLLYPLFVYKGMESGMNWLMPVIFSYIFLDRAWRSQRPSKRLGYALVAVLLLLGAYYLQPITAKIMPVLVQLMLMVFFGRGLLEDNRQTFIENVVRLQYPESPPAVSQYCRQLTWVWTAFFAANALVCTVLAIWGSGFWWALYNGVLIYVLMGVLGIGEYVYRRIRFTDLSVLHQGIPDPKASVKAMINNGRKVFLEMKGR
jgi:uncharacterized membrane protein